MNFLAFYSVRFKAEGSSGIGIWTDISQVTFNLCFINIFR